MQYRASEINMNVEESYYICESLHAGLVASCCLQFLQVMGPGQEFRNETG